MRVISLIAFLGSLSLMLLGLFSPGARWFLPFGFVLTISVGVSSLGFWATQDLDTQSRNVMPEGESRESDRRAA